MLPSLSPQLYKDYGASYKEVDRAFAALKPVTVAIVFNAVKKLAEHAFQSPQPEGRPAFDIRLLLLAIVSAFWWVLHVSMGPCRRCHGVGVYLCAAGCCVQLGVHGRNCTGGFLLCV